MMKELMLNKDLSDVTLVTEDKKHVNANKNILSACSPFFRDILKSDKSSSSIVYLKGIQFTEIESIMQFIYLGEATFFEERMDEFLAVAKSLEITDLCNAGTETNDGTEDDPSKYNPGTSTEIAEEPTELYDNVKKKTQNVKKEVVGVNGTYECNQCEKTFPLKSSLYTHTKSKHEGVTFDCDQCDFRATQKITLTRHIQNKHEGIKYPCDQCEHQATRKEHLMQHVNSKHSRI